MNPRIIFFVKTVFLILLIGCSNDKQVDFEEALVLYKENKLQQSLPLFRQYIMDYPDDAEAYPWLAETYRRLGNRSEALNAAFKALELDSCSSFAHTVIAATINRLPEKDEPDTTWIHINKAVQCDSTDGNAWNYLCVESMLRNKFDLFNKAAAKLKETGFLTDAVLAYGKWMMRTLPENAVIITNGDMDTYPMLALQAAVGYRTDVAVVEKEWLGLKQYLFYLRDKYGLTIPFSEEQLDLMFESKAFPENMLMVSGSVFGRWLEMSTDGSLSNPIALAITVNENFYSDFKTQLQYAGPFLLYSASAQSDSIDMLAIRRSIAGIKIDDFKGAWVSGRDYSPIRIIYTNRLAGNITFMALEYVRELIKSERFERAAKILDWAEEYEDATELGPVKSDQISEFRKIISRGKN